MKRLDHAELQEQLHDALRLEAASIPALVDTDRLAEQLTLRLGRFDIFDPEAQPAPAAPMPMFPDLPAEIETEPASVAPDASFAQWLLLQAGRAHWVGDLARAGRNDPSFPRAGGVEDVRAWLDRRHASGDDYEALEDAELDWLAL